MALQVAPAQITHSDIVAEFGDTLTGWRLSQSGGLLLQSVGDPKGPGDMIKESDFYGISSASPEYVLYDRASHGESVPGGATQGVGFSTGFVQTDQYSGSMYILKSNLTGFEFGGSFFDQYGVNLRSATPGPREAFDMTSGFTHMRWNNSWGGVQNQSVGGGNWGINLMLNLNTVANSNLAPSWTNQVVDWSVEIKAYPNSAGQDSMVAAEFPSNGYGVARPHANNAQLYGLRERVHHPTELAAYRANRPRANHRGNIGDANPMFGQAPYSYTSLGTNSFAATYQGYVNGIVWNGGTKPANLLGQSGTSNSSGAWNLSLFQGADYAPLANTNNVILANWQSNSAFAYYIAYEHANSFGGFEVSRTNLVRLINPTVNS